MLVTMDQIKEPRNTALGGTEKWNLPPLGARLLTGLASMENRMETSKK